MKNSGITREIQAIDEELAGLPDAYLVYKTIRGHEQPYLQWHDEGKTKSRYVKKDEREQILLEIVRKEELLITRKRLLTYQSALQDAWKKYPGLHMQSSMTGRVGLGIQYFSEMIEKGFFYVDKSMLIKEWWEDGSKVNLITRPRRFGKSLNLDMLDCFFSERYAKRKNLFENLQIWEQREYRKMQGTWPVLHFDFSNMRTKNYTSLCAQMRNTILKEYCKHNLMELSDWTPDEFWPPEKIEFYIQRLCALLSKQSGGRRIIILIDEYDTPIQEAWNTPYYKDTVSLMRLVFHSLLKTNEYLEKAMLTGITRVSRESLFSGLNNLRVSSVMNDEYSFYFGFTEEEVFASLDSQDIQEHTLVKKWYDGFTIGDRHDIYNPWSITNYLLNRKFDTYWANTSANTLIGQFVHSASLSFQNQFVQLMNGESIEVTLEENIVWDDLEKEESLIWGLILATGYITGTCLNSEKRLYQIRITNFEVTHMFEKLFLRWFSGRTHSDYNEFINAMFRGDSITMTDSLNEIMLESFSYFDISSTSENRKTENFYHGFVLGMVSTLRNHYRITSNRESGYGRYDIMIEPREIEKVGDEMQEDKMQAYAIILEFKVCNRLESELSLAECADKALDQIRERKYSAHLLGRGIPADHIRSYGIAFRGKVAEVRME